MRNQSIQTLTGKEIANIGIRLIQQGKIRNHKLRSENIPHIHNSTVEKREFQTFRRFLPEKNGCMVWELTGRDS